MRTQVPVRSSYSYITAPFTCSWAHTKSKYYYHTEVVCESVGVFVDSSIMICKHNLRIRHEPDGVRFRRLHA